MKKARRNFRRRQAAKAQAGNAPRPAPAPVAKPAVAPLQDNILRAAEQKIESQLTPKNRANYLRVVVAGMEAGKGFIATLQHSQDPIKDCAVGAVNLAVMLRKQSRNTMPVQAMVPGAMTLMLHALDFADRAGIVKVGVPELGRATHIYTDYIMHVFGITKQKFAALSQRTHAVMQDHSQMEMLARHAGVAKDPRASEPTPMPQGGLINGAADAG